MNLIVLILCDLRWFGLIWFGQMCVGLDLYRLDCVCFDVDVDLS